MICKHERQIPMPESAATVCEDCGLVFVYGEPWNYKSGNIMEWVKDLVKESDATSKEAK